MQSELSQHLDGVDRYISMHITLSAPVVVCSDGVSEVTWLPHYCAELWWRDVVGASVVTTRLIWNLIHNEWWKIPAMKGVSEIESYQIPYAVVEAVSRQVFRRSVLCVAVAVGVCGSVGKQIGQC